MIDFRYHLVSLVSVFLALAVGIVLGAGPLKGSIGDQLTQRVEALRQDRDALHDQLATANSAVSHRDDYLKKITPELIDGQLTGRSVVVVTLPGVDSGDVSSLVAAVGTAGGRVTGQVSLSSTWADAGSAASREKALTTITTNLPAASTTDVSGSTDEQLNSYLAEALVDTGGGPLARGSAIGKAVIKGLKSADLIGVKGDLAGPAGSAVVMAPALPTTGTQPTPTATTTQSLVALTEVLDSTGGGTVVEGPASSATATGLIALIRKDDDAVKQVSTVDSGSTSMGPPTSVLALHEQIAGGVGQYGFSAGASAPLPGAPATSGS